MGNKRYFLNWNNGGIYHSTNGLPTQYWKLFEDKISPGKFIFRASKVSNYKHGGQGMTFIK